MRKPRRYLALGIALAACRVAAQPHDPATGSFRVDETLAGIVGEEAANRVASLIAPDEPLSWEMYVPERYDPDAPPGLMVYISPTSFGDIPRDWNTVMDDYNLIWIGANRSGNPNPVGRRVILAQIAPTLVRRNYVVNKERIYISGFSGGGRTASMVAAENADLFRGGIFNCGANFWDRAQPRLIDVIRQNHYVFISGTLDQALRPTRRTYKKYIEAGVVNSRLVVIRDMPHRNPNRHDFADAVTYLDSRLAPGTE